LRDSAFLPIIPEHDRDSIVRDALPGVADVIGYDAIEHACRTDVGVRRSHNQDAFGIHMAGDPERWREQGHIFIVADGMGGHAVGEKASAKAVRDIPHLIPKLAQEGPAAALRKAYFETNAGINSIGQENPEFRGLGTTATTLWLRPEGAYVGHVGDSRVYRLRDSVIEQLTFDHSAVWELAKRQGLKPEQLQGVRANVILRSLGPEPLVEVDVEGPHPYQPGDTFLICSDGLSGQVSDYEIGAIISALPPNEATSFLVELANLRGGPDNVTVLVVRVGGASHALQKTQVLGLMPHLTWPVWTMAGGIVLAAAALGLFALNIRGIALFTFILGVLAVFAGLGGLIVHHRKAEETDFFTEEHPLHVYSRTACKVEPALLDKLVKAEITVRNTLSEADRAEIGPTVDKYISEAESFRNSSDLHSAFRAHCRATYELVSRFNRHRQKEEVFSPVWDKMG
jgi:protein phosphatase